MSLMTPDIVWLRRVPHRHLSGCTRHARQERYAVWPAIRDREQARRVSLWPQRENAVSVGTRPPAGSDSRKPLHWVKTDRQQEGCQAYFVL